MCFDLNDANDSNETTTTKSTLTASQVLLGAVKLIETHGFAKRRIGKGRTGTYSAMAAVRQVALGNAYAQLIGSPFHDEAQRIQGWFFKNKGDTLAWWSSRSAASKVRVLSAMRKAAEELAR